MGDREPTWSSDLPARAFRRDKVSFVRDTYTFNFPSPPSEFVDAFRNYYGPTMNAFEAAEKNGRADDLKKELEALFESQNTARARMSPPFRRPSCG